MELVANDKIKVTSCKYASRMKFIMELESCISYKIKVLELARVHVGCMLVMEPNSGETDEEGSRCRKHDIDPADY